MKTSWNEIQTIEAYLLKQMSPTQHLLFEAQLLVQVDLQKNTALQKQAYTLIQQYSRKKLKAEIAAVHHQLFTNPQHNSFRKFIQSIF